MVANEILPIIKSVVAGIVVGFTTTYAISDQLGTNMNLWFSSFLVAATLYQ